MSVEKEHDDLSDVDDIPENFFDDFNKEFLDGLGDLDEVSDKDDHLIDGVLQKDIKLLKETNQDLKKEIEELKRKAGVTGAGVSNPHWTERASSNRVYDDKSPRGERSSRRERSPHRSSVYKSRRYSRSPLGRKSPHHHGHDHPRFASPSRRRRRSSSRPRRTPSTHRRTPRRGSRSPRRKRKSSNDSIPDIGKRRDANKVNRAIKQDKVSKVQEYLSKRLQSGDNIAPPGTELDDYYEPKLSKPMLEPPVQRIVPHLPHLSKNFDLRNVMSRRVSPTPMPPGFLPEPAMEPVMAPGGPVEYFPPHANFQPQYYQQQFIPPPMPVPAPLPGEPLQMAVAQPYTAPPVNQGYDPPPSAVQEDPISAELDKLFEEGKISEDQYLKLRPNPLVPVKKSSAVDFKERMNLISNCQEAIKKLSNLHLPNKLLIDTAKLKKQDEISVKYCSPLKRTRTIEFSYTTTDATVQQAQNKVLIESIADAIEMDKVMKRHIAKTLPKFKDAETQTQCETCETCSIRKGIKTKTISTEIDRDEIYKSAHTQVVDSELATSKTVFNSSGPSTEGSMSLAHMTPAQLVSQLAAKAKHMQASPSGYGQYQKHGSQSNPFLLPTPNYQGSNYQNQRPSAQNQSTGYSNSSSSSQNQGASYQNQNNRAPNQSSNYQNRNTSNQNTKPPNPSMRSSDPNVRPGNQNLAFQNKPVAYPGQANYARNHNNGGGGNYQNNYYK